MVDRASALCARARATVASAPIAQAPDSVRSVRVRATENPNARSNGDRDGAGSLDCDLRTSETARRRSAPIATPHRVGGLSHVICLVSDCNLSGSLSCFSAYPNGHANRISSLIPNCRVCRVSRRGERSGEIRELLTTNKSGAPAFVLESIFGLRGGSFERVQKR